MNGYVLYRGPSLLDGAPIVAIATGFASGSANRKTGAMIQTWILRADVEPHVAIKTGDDASICGSCPHRGEALGDRTANRSCYVLVHNAPLAVYRAWMRGSYGAPEDLMALGAGRAIRIGAYGDPAAVPAHIWHNFVARADNFTGYTHAWHGMPAAVAAAFQPICMASCDGPEERAVARRAGWRCFTVLPKGHPMASDVRFARKQGQSIICPASEERGKRTTCESCGLCKGTSAKTDLDIVIGAHGSGAKHVKG